MQHSDYFDTLYRIVDGLNERFPNGNTPFQIMSRLCEESGELAKSVNHFEGTGVKLQKYGEPNRAELAYFHPQSTSITQTNRVLSMQEKKTDGKRLV